MCYVPTCYVSTCYVLACDVRRAMCSSLRGGIGYASCRGMSINDFRDLQCWQLASSIREEVIAICANQRVAADFRFCNSFLDAAGSVCRNLSEGFARFESRQIVMFFGYALASLAEVQDHLEECRARHFIDQPQYEMLADRAEHTKATVLKFLRAHRTRAASPARPRTGRRR